MQLTSKPLSSLGWTHLILLIQCIQNKGEIKRKLYMEMK